MKRSEKIVQARKLREEGLTWREIGERLGMATRTAEYYASKTTLLSRACGICASEFEPAHGNEIYCSPECLHAAENERKRRCEETIGRGRCIDCGNPLAANSKWRGSRRCRTCEDCRRAEPVDRRARKIEAWWAEGLPMREIAGRLGCSKGHLGKDIHDLREKGYNLPYRYNSGKRRGRKFPEQVAA